MKPKKNSSTLDLCYIALFAVLLVICAWIAIPTVPPFTLQTLGVILTAGLLGWKRGLASLGIYVLLGCIGLPVFAGFKAGLGVLLGPTGGYFLGFVFTILLVGACANQEKTWLLLGAMILGQLLGYGFGTLWFMLAYAGGSGAVGLATALSLCVLPFLLPDLAKTALALFLIRRLRPLLRAHNV